MTQVDNLKKEKNMSETKSKEIMDKLEVKRNNFEQEQSELSLKVQFLEQQL